MFFLNDRMAKRGRSLFFIVLAVLTSAAEAATDSFAASGTWTAPAGVSSITVEAWGGGGAGGGATANPAKGGGGAGGQYAKRLVTVVPGNSYAVAVGAGGAGSTGNGAAGGDSTFATNAVVAKGGAGGTGAANGVAGFGTTTGGVGDVVYQGGNGAAGAVSSACNNGGAGGGGAGSGGAGGNASGNTGGAGRATGGGSGGNGSNSSGAGLAGSVAGGGGAGACAESDIDRSGGAGASGQVSISYFPPTATTTAATSVTVAGATLNGSVSSNGAGTAVTFEYGLTASYGNSVTATQSPLAPLASNSSVSVSLTGLSCGTTYHFRVDSSNSGGIANGGDLTFTTSTCPFTCSPPSNIPAGVAVTCQCDTFARTILNPSTIFGSNWIVSTSDATGILPSIVNSGYLRLTNNTGNNAKAATVPGIFPAAGNYISVEFQQYAYNGTGADGIAVTLSDYSVPAVPGAYGGSLGYAQETGIHDGFAGGWLGVALDEYGNYQNPTEGRLGGQGFIVQSVGARGSGTGQTGYRWLGGTSSLSPTIDNHTSTTRSLGYYYQIIVDARNDPASTAVAVNRDAGGGYTSLISIPNVYSAASTQGFTQAPVPTNWQISFTGSTGGSTNIHEIGNLRICASAMAPPGGGTATGFNAIDEAYGTPPSVAVQNYLSGHIYTKLVGTPFKLDVAALKDSQIVTTYAAGSAKTVTVKLVDNSDGLNDTTKDCALSCTSTCTSKTSITGGTQSLVFAYGATDKGQKQSSNFTINSAYQKLVAIINDDTTTACSTNSFSVRPLSIASVTSANATNTSTSGTPKFKAGSDNFSLTATTTGVAGSPGGYTGLMKINSVAVQAVSPATVAGTLSGTFPAAISSTPSSAATSSAFTYSEVGAFYLLQPDFSIPRIPGVYDDNWTVIDSGVDQDCVSGTSAAAYSNTKDANGKYGCNFGISSNTGAFGRFIPDHFGVTGSVQTRSDLAAGSSFTYMDEPMKLSLVVTAYNKSEAATQNYAGSLAKLDAATLGSTDLTQWTCTSGTQCMGLAAVSGSTTLTSRLAIDTASTNSTLPRNTTTPAGTISGWSGGTSYFTLFSTFRRAAAPDGPYDNSATNILKVGGKPLDSDGVTLPPRASADVAHCVNLDVTTGTENTATVCNPGGTAEDNLRRKLFETSVRFGRLWLGNAYGSDRTALSIPYQFQYWNGSAFIRNLDDSLSAFSSGSLGLGNYQRAITSTNMGVANFTVGANASGAGSIAVAPPAAAAGGSVDLVVDLGSSLSVATSWTPTVAATVAAAMPYLHGKWYGSNYDRDPTCRATFGIFGNSLRKGPIYIRENF